MIDLIAFDADDTLWENETLYIRANEKYRQLLSNYHNPEWIQRKLNQTEIVNIQSYGYGIKSFTLSMIEAAVDLSEGQIEGRVVQEIIGISKEMLEAEVQLLEHAEETLAQLSTTHELMLITKGDLFEQGKKVERSGLAKYFRFIEIVGEKTTKSYRVLLEKYNLDPKRFLMVGNSLRSDIMPVVALGGKAVYVPHPHTWVYETVVDQTTGEEEYFEIEHLGLLPALVRRLSGH